MTSAICSRLWTAVFLLMTLSASSLKINDNGYEDLVVAIHPDVPENREIIQQIQKMFTDASAYLYLATRKRAFFRNVTILVPTTWSTNPSWDEVEGETFEAAEVRIDKRNPIEGHTPYTFQPNPCGEPGKYIHLTPEYVLDDDVNRETNWGDPGRLLVHEFAHLRYGVFDEYGKRENKKYPLFYVDNESGIRPTGCTTEIEGTIIDPSTAYSLCKINPETKLPAPGCTFLPKRESNSAVASVMCMQFLEKVVSFCEEGSSDPHLEHNDLAPTIHNKICNKKGTWDIIRNHQDFFQNNPPRDILQTSPQFKIIQRKTSKETEGCGRRIVLVLDVSGSMKSNQRYFKLAQTADKFIQDVLPLGSELGIIVFSTTARQWTPMILVENDAAKTTLTRNLPKLKNFGGSTAIGKGLLEAIKLLKYNGNSAKGGRILLITDGGENVSPLVKDVFDDVLASGVTIHTVAYSSAADKSVADLAKKTGGLYAYYSENSISISSLDSAMERLWDDLSVCKKDKYIEITRKSIELRGQSTYNGEVTIDSSLGNNTLFLFTLPSGSTSKITIVSSVGTVYNQNSKEYRKDTELSLVRFHIPLAESGRWTFEIKSTSRSTVKETIAISIKSQVLSGQQTYEVDSWMSSLSVSLPDVPVIYVHVHEGYSPVIAAKVEVTVDRTPAEPVTLALKDNGILPDNLEDDGVYSGNFLGYSGNQRYQTEIRVTSILGETFVVKGRQALSGALSVYQNVTPTTVLESVENFTRSTSPGAFDVHNFTSGVDQFPPNRVTDLSAVISDSDARVVTLTWTAPGDDLTDGTAHRYEILMAENHTVFKENLTDAVMVKNDTVIKESLQPLPGGTSQTIDIRIPKLWTTDVYVLVLLSYDETNQGSDLSNYQTVTFKTPHFPARFQPPTTTTKPEQPDGDKIPVGIIAGCIAGGFVLIIIVIIIVVVVKKRKQRNKKKSSGSHKATSYDNQVYEKEKERV